MMHMRQRSPRKRSLLIAAATTLAAGVVAPLPAATHVSAASFVVTSTANSGAGTLRDAIQSANAVAGEDTITFNLNPLGPPPHTITLTNNITVTDDLRIEGPGQAALTLTNPTSRVFDVDAGSLYVDSLTIDSAGSNAIVFTSPSGSVELDDVTISDSANHALNVVSATNVTVTNSNLANAKDPLFKGDGVHATNVSGAILIEDVAASGNEDNFEFANVTGTVTLRRVTATSAVDEAADFQNVGGVVIDSSRFDANNDQVDINVVSGSVSIVDTTIAGTIIDDGLEISDVGGSVSVTGSSISGSGMAGVFFSGSTTPTNATVLNSTISGNGNSGVVVLAGATVAVNHSTIVGNGNRGVYALSGSATVSHSILIGNASQAVGVGSGSATVQYSLLPTGSGFAGAGNVLTADAKLGPLTDNGGPTETHLPLAGSPAINAGNPAVSAPPSVDQRGSTRLVGTIDIGSVEVSATPPPPNRGSVSILPATLNVAESVGSVPFTITRSGGSDGLVSVKVSTQSLSAAAPGDYVAFEQTVSFSSGQAGSKVVNLTIVDDAKIESAESMKVRLSQASPGLAIGTAESTVTILDNDAVSPPPLDPELDAAGRFVALPPKRLFDTRAGEPAPGPKGKVGAGQTIDVQITGQGGVPANATAVVMNVTMTESVTPGFITAWATGSARPLTSNLNYLTPNTTRPNLVTVPIGVGGKVSLYALTPAHLLGDVAGYYVDVDVPVAAGRFVSLTPKRVFDTRPGESAPGPKGLMGANTTIDVQVAGQGGLPSTGISAVVMNLTATEAQAIGFVTAYPTNVARPLASVLNMAGPGDTVANLVVLPLGPDGKLRFYTLNGTHLLGDVMGYFTDGTAPVTTDGLFVPLAPNRVFDSRPAEAAPGPKGFVGAGSAVDFVGRGVGSIPADAAAVVFNITATESAGPNFVTGWPTGLTRPLASLLNLGTGDTRPNATILAPGSGNKVSLYTLAGAHLLADTFGYYLG
jgi:hypothetical protein